MEYTNLRNVAIEELIIQNHGIAPTEKEIQQKMADIAWEVTDFEEEKEPAIILNNFDWDF